MNFRAQVLWVLPQPPVVVLSAWWTIQFCGPSGEVKSPRWPDPYTPAESLRVTTGTDIFIDAAGAPAVFTTVIANAKWHAKLVMVGVQEKGEADRAIELTLAPSAAEKVVVTFDDQP
ncbi:hypothetical protein [Streptomyces sp. NPDC097610]|uniref:hypothetical protein n=1 Tax=Streptomyces sp. NPDC097610 TaxID=3157227 RepID=UPI00331AA7B0